MGAWGSRPLQNDVAADYVYDLLDLLRDGVRSALTVVQEDLTESHLVGGVAPYIVSTLDLMYVVAKHAFPQVKTTWCVRGRLLPDADEILRWKDDLLADWDAVVERSDNARDLQSRRPKVAAAFDQLAALSKQQANGGPASSAETASSAGFFIGTTRRAPRPSV